LIKWHCTSKLKESKKRLLKDELVEKNEETKKIVLKLRISLPEEHGEMEWKECQ